MSTSPEELSQNNTLAEGQTFEGRYQILSVLGKGGVGVVYKARHTHMDKMVAIKTLLQSVVSDDVESFQRFEREARTASSLDHVNIIKIHDFGKTASGLVFLVMEYLGDQTLEGLLLEKGFLDVDRFLSISVQICDGLQHAHKHQVIHRDIKPSNIMLLSLEGNEECVKIVDFGLAKLTTQETAQSVTKTGAIIGTPLFMSPEQCRGLTLDHRSDIYSLGCVFYLALTGRVPIQGATTLDTLFQHTALKPAPFAASLHLPPRLEQVIFKALEKDPDLRQQSMLELRTEIQNAIFDPTFRASQRVSSKQLRGTKSELKQVSANEVEHSPKINKQAVVALVAAALVAACVSFALTNKPMSTPTVTNPAAAVVAPAISAVSSTKFRPALVAPEKFKPVVKEQKAKPEKKTPATVVAKVSKQPAEPPTDLQQIGSLHKLAWVDAARKDWTGALAAFYACLRLEAKVYGNRDVRLFPTLSGIMHCQLMLNNVSQTRGNLMLALAIFSSHKSAVLENVSRKPQAARIWRTLASVCLVNGAPSHDIALLNWAADFFELARTSWVGDKSTTEYVELCKEYCRALDLCGNRAKENLIRAEINLPPLAKVGPPPGAKQNRGGQRESIKRTGRMVIHTYHY